MEPFTGGIVNFNFANYSPRPMLPVDPEVVQLIASLKKVYSETEGNKEGNSELRVFLIEELVGDERLRTHKRLGDIFRSLHKKQDRKALEDLCGYLRLELGRLQKLMDNYLVSHDTWDEKIKASMETILSSDLWCAFLPMSVTDREQVRKSIEPSCIIPRKYLLGKGYRHVSNMNAYPFFHVSTNTCAHSLKGGSE